MEAFIESFLFGSVIFLPVYELFLYPIFHRCLRMINSHWKFISGVFLLLAETVVLLVIESVARHQYYLTNNSSNTTIACIGHGTLSTSMDFRFMVVPLLLHSLSITAIAIGAFEFFCISNTLFNERTHNGHGLLYTHIVRSSWNGHKCTVYKAILQLGHWNHQLWVLVYAVLLLVIEVLGGLMFVAMKRWYKKRKREDVLPNEHIFMERYYDRDN